MTRPTLRLTVLVAAALVLTAMLGATAVAARPAAIAPEQLVKMVLPRTLIGGARLDSLQVSTSSGEINIEDSPRYTLDPRDDAGAIADAGWVGGYDASWGPGFAPDGAFFGGTTVQLFDSEPSAALFHARQIESFRLFRGKLIEGGWTLRSTESWRVPALGADAWAVRNVFRSKAGTFYDTEVHLRVKNLVAEASIISSRDSDLRRAIETDGKALQLRIKRVAGIR